MPPGRFDSLHHEGHSHSHEHESVGVRDRSRPGIRIGIGGPVGYTAFATPDMAREGRSPLSPAGTVGDGIPEWVDFEMGGTPTPINRDGLVTASELISIVKRFFETGELHPDFTWE